MESPVFRLIEQERKRQTETIELIASENFVSDNVLRALGSCLTNKYTEGYPEVRRGCGKSGRYYGGCRYYDELEEYCCDMWKKVFRTEYHVNVQPHSGSQANMAAYAAVLKPGDAVLSMGLNDGGHLTHGSPVNFSGKTYNFISYRLTENGFIDYEDIRKKIREFHPSLILAGASAYPREIDFRLIREIIDIEAKADPFYKEKAPYFMVDMAHIAGLVAAGEHKSPFGFADIITTTTHKTLRGPRGGLIFCGRYLAQKVDGAVFPGTQGGPLQNVIAAKAIAAEEACTGEFREYIRDVVRNSKAMADTFERLGYEVVTGGTDNHLFLLDFSRTHPHLTGLAVQNELDRYGITLNKNCVPNERRIPALTSGVRIGTAAETTKGKTEGDFVEIARRIDSIISEMRGDNTLWRG
ncbi:MAG: serine hydroxymethyltransferase [Lachnospiraceae bacterium]|nr:serine hydroxymethyltransferase [Lachnospiraceae bacterium]